MKIVWLVLAGIVVLGGIGFGVLAYMNRPISEEAVTEKIQRHLEKVVAKSDSLSSAMFTIYSERTGYFEQFAVGTAHRDSDEPVRTDSPYHSASVGKTMNAAVFGMLVDEGKIGFDDPIATWLGEDVLDRLFVVGGIDYSDQVTVGQLLSHTSGVADYFEGPVVNGPTMLQLLKSEPDRTFTPADLLAFTRERQVPAGLPGRQFHYSDTGYILLGLILEKIEGKPYADILEQRIFDPLGMNDSYLMFYGDAAADPIGIYIDEIDLSDRNALSVDWSGGGVVTTMDDLLTFMKALTRGTLLSDETYGRMTDFRHRYEKGIDYGMGMMYFDFGELSFLLKLSGMKDVYGAVGATGTYALYDEEKDAYFIGNFGSLDYAEKGIEELVAIRMIYDRMKE